MAESGEKSWFTPGRIVVLAVVFVALVAYVWYRWPQPAPTNTTSPTVQANRTAVNTSGGAGSGSAGNTNTSVANVNTAVEPVRTAPAAFTPIQEPETEKIVYQLGNHGFQFDAPTAWNFSKSSNGSDRVFAYTTSQNLISGALPARDGLSFSVSIAAEQKTAMSLEERMDDLLDNLDALETAQKTKRTIVVDDEESLEGQARTTFESQTSVSVYILIPHNSYIYNISVYTTSELWESTKSTFESILASFSFVDPIPLQTVRSPERLSKIASGGTLTIDWADAPVPLNLDDPILGNTDLHIVSRFYYGVGTVQNGTYRGMPLVLIFETPEGPAFQPNLYRAVYDEATKRLIYLEKHSDNLSYLGALYFDAGATIAGLDMPKSIPLPNSDISLRAESFQLRMRLDDLINVSRAFVASAAGTVYYIPSLGCFVVVTPDFLLQRYSYDLPFAKNFRDREFVSGMTFYEPQITWADGTANASEYTYSDYGGCGVIGCVNVMTDEELGGSNAVVQIGTTSSGDPVYFFRDADASLLTSEFELYNSTVYEPSLKLTKEQYISRHPLFFWKDPYGQWLMFRRTDLIPAVECGKPVIYLYPETMMKVNVQVSPSGGFTVTDPAYPNGGWTVTATPEGTLTTADGRTYGSLFWEGKGLNYARPKQGFVVRRDGVSSFLTTTLSKLGLNDKESAEFMEYWVPRMQDKPYYFVTFVDQPTFDQLAPLAVTPRPDTVIRVFMDYEGLDRPITVAPLNIVTPERTGFTVVEWGGALQR